MYKKHEIYDPSGTWHDSHLEALDHELGPKHAGDNQVNFNLSHRTRVRDEEF